MRLEPNTNAMAFENRHFFDDLGTKDPLRIPHAHAYRP